MAWSKGQKLGFLGFCLWVFGVGLTNALTFEVGTPVPIIAAVAIWIGTWLATTSKFKDGTEMASQTKQDEDA